MAISRESNNNLMLSYAKSLLVHNKIKPIEAIHKRIDAITAQDLLAVANEHLNVNDFDFLYFEGK